MAGVTELDDAPPRAAGKQPERGESIGRYVVLARLGAGGMGVVFAAYDPELDRKVAIKLLHHPGMGSPNDTATVRLLREAQAMARLGHPNVVAVHDVGEYAEQVFIAMEFVAGSTVRQWLAQAKRSQREILDVFLQAGHGLAAAHEKGLVHRDLKPDNLMIGDDGRVRVMDFGLARSAGSPARDPVPLDTTSDSQIRPTRDALDTPLTRAGSVMGTPAYMAPEQHLGAPVKPATDQFAFCVALYEALYGQHPFAGETLAALVFNVNEGSIRDPPSGASVPAHVEAAIRRGLATDPADRFPAMSELLVELARGPSRRRPIALAIAAVSLLAAAGFGGRAWTRERAVATCDREARAIEATWTPERARQLADGFMATALVNAEDTAARVDARLTEWIASWTTLRRDTCVAADIDGTLDPGAAERARECFDEQHIRVARLIDELAQPDPALLHAAVGAAVGLPAPAECTDASRQPPRPPDDPQSRASVRALREDLAAAYAALSAGRYDAGHELGEATLQKAGVLGWEPLIAEAMLLVGQALSQRSEDDAAVERLEDAYHLAGAIGHDDVALRCALLLTSIEAAERHDAAAAERWARLTKMLLRRLDREQDLVGAKALGAFAKLQRLRSEYDEAQAMIERSIELREAALGPTHLEVAASLAMLAQIQLDRGKYRDAITSLERALAIHVEVQGPDHPSVGHRWQSIGHAYNRIGDDHEAMRAFDRARVIWERTLPPDHPQLASLHNSIGAALYSQGEYDAALREYTIASEMARKRLGEDDVNTAMYLVNTGAAHHALRQLDEAQAVYERALPRLVAALGEDHVNVASVHNNAAQVFQARERWDDAIAGYERALAIYERTMGADHPVVGTIFDNIGDVHYRRGDLRSAQVALERALVIREGADVAVQDRAITGVRLARVLWDSGSDRERAVQMVRAARATVRDDEPSHRQATELADRWLAEHVPPR